MGHADWYGDISNQEYTREQLQRKMKELLDTQGHIEDLKQMIRKQKVSYIVFFTFLLLGLIAFVLSFILTVSWRRVLFGGGVLAILLNTALLGNSELNELRNAKYREKRKKEELIEVLKDAYEHNKHFYIPRS